MATSNTPPIPDTLYHVKRTITDFHSDPSGATRTTDILGTFTNLIAAKNAARSALASEGYLKDDFEVYEQKDEDGEGEWKHEDGVLIWAKAPKGQEFEVRLDTKPNLGQFKGNEHGEVEGVLHYGMCFSCFAFFFFLKWRVLFCLGGLERESKEDGK